MSDIARPKSIGDELSADEVNADLPIIVTAGETINGATLPVPVYMDTADEEVKACDGDNVDTIVFIGFAISNSTDGNDITLQKDGVVSGFSGLTVGEKYYIQDTAGTIGTAPGSFKTLVGISISATQILIRYDEIKIITGFDSPYYTYQLPYVEDEGWTFSDSANFKLSKVYISNSAQSAYTELFGSVSSPPSPSFNSNSGIWQFPLYVRGLPVSTNEIRIGVKQTAFGTYNNNDDELYFSIDSSGVLTAISRNTVAGASEETVVSGVTLLQLNVYKIEWDSVTDVAKFYVNGILKATHSTTVPSSSGAVGIRIELQMNASSNVAACGVPTISIKL